MGDVLDGLSEDRRRQLSFWTAAKTIVPGNKVFPCANAQIWSPPNWILNHNASIDLSGRRHGVDVAIAAYNADDYVIECAQSILCEGRDDVRVIIVDDGSTDGSGDRAAEHFKDEPRVRVERKPNGGCASARNYGRLVSDATHIAFVDADDFVTPNMFGDLYDLALYSGCEVTQSSFDFYDDSLEKPYYPSYEEDVFKNIPRQTFKGQPVFRLQSADIIKGQPTIWRKVYRRDFLDSKDIYFPENVRAYDDYIFQMFTLTAARDVLMLPDHYYHYRQHPAQDIKQGDERHFYMLFMFRDLVARAVRESWPNFRPYAESITDSINWSAQVLKPDLRDSFIEATARFCVGIRRIYGPGVMSDDLIDKIEQPDFRMHFDQILEETKGVSDGVHWAYFCGPTITPEFIRMRRSMKKAG
nr:glycosyltransferase [Mesobacterium pallidum]